MNYYDLLEVPRDASLEQIKKSYERLSMKALWDKPMRAKLDEAYDTLSEPSARSAYDAQLPVELKSPENTADVERTMLTPEAQRTQVIEPSPCPVCQTINDPSSQYCLDCGYELSGGAVESFEHTPEEPAGLIGQSGFKLFLRVGANSVGRVGSDVVIPDPSVSRHHATIELSAEQAMLTDQNSTNGTKLNGRRLVSEESQRLYDGDTIRFGQAEFEFVCPDLKRQESAASSEVTAPQTEDVKPPRWLFCEASGTTSVKLSPGEAFVGRRPECQVRLNDPYASGRHLRLVLTDDQATVEELGSTNGTLFNGQPLLPGTIQDVNLGDQIQIGTVVYSLVPLPDEAVSDAQ
ncbi:MAG: FHA domain-containing protein [Armatimonadota bacterium]